MADPNCDEASLLKTLSQLQSTLGLEWKKLLSEPLFLITMTSELNSEREQHKVPFLYAVAETNPNPAIFKRMLSVYIDAGVDVKTLNAHGYTIMSWVSESENAPQKITALLPYYKIKHAVEWQQLIERHRQNLFLLQKIVVQHLSAAATEDKEAVLRTWLAALKNYDDICGSKLVLVGIAGVIAKQHEWHWLSDELRGDRLMAIYAKSTRLLILRCAAIMGWDPARNDVGQELKWNISRQGLAELQQQSQLLQLFAPAFYGDVQSLQQLLEKIQKNHESKTPSVIPYFVAEWLSWLKPSVKQSPFWDDDFNHYLQYAKEQFYGWDHQFAIRTLELVANVGCIKECPFEHRLQGTAARPFYSR